MEIANKDNPRSKGEDLADTWAEEEAENAEEYKQGGILNNIQRFL